MLSTILNDVVTAITTLISGIASALTDGFEAVFTTTPSGGTTTISTTGTWIIVLLGIALSFAVFRWVMGLVRSKS